MRNIVNYDYKVQVVDELKEPPFVIVKNYFVVFLAEYFGTFTFMFFGCGCYHSSILPDWNEFVGSYMFAMVFGSAVQIFLYVSNGHLNPVITLIFYMYGYISILFVILYIVAQILGSITGVALFKYMAEFSFTNKTVAMNPGICETRPMIGTGKTFLWEFLATFLIGLVIASFMDPRSKDRRENYAIKIAIMMAVLTATLYPYTGGGMNPARSFAPSLVNGNWDDQWVYWVAPITGGVLGAFVYHSFFFPPAEEVEELVKNENDAVILL